MSKPLKYVLASAYDGREAERSDASSLGVFEETLAQQNMADEYNPNSVMEKFARTGDMSLLQKTNPQYGDFTGVHDYHSALNIVIAANEAFAELPASLRARFDNDPEKYVAFVGDPTNRSEMIELGMMREGLSPEEERPQEAGESSGGNPAGTGKTPSKKGSKAAEAASSDDE